MLSMFSWIKVQHQGIDVCINNAGLALPEHLLSGKTSGWMTMMDVCNSNKQFSLSNMQNESWPNVHILQVNVIALSVCTREAYQSMKERKVDDGHIININRYRCILLHLCSVYSFSCLCSDKIIRCLKIHVFSICGHRVINNADAHFYAASKYAVTALTEGLRQELREAKTHIRATVRAGGSRCASFEHFIYVI